MLPIDHPRTVGVKLSIVRNLQSGIDASLYVCLSLGCTQENRIYNTLQAWVAFGFNLQRLLIWVCFRLFFSQQILTLQVVIVYNVVAIGTDHKNTYDQWIPLDFHLYYLVVHALMVAMVPEHCGLLGFDTKIEKVSWMPHSCDCFFYSTCHTVVWSLINLSWTRSFPQGQ